MGKYYTTSTNLATAYDVTIGKPLDIRTVVDTYHSLISPVTWGHWQQTTYVSYWVLYCYRGMVVSVVADDNDTKNGLYLLKGDSFNSQSFLMNPSATLENDWIKIGGMANVILDNYTIKNNTEEYQSSDVQGSGLHVVRVDGGDY